MISQPGSPPPPITDKEHAELLVKVLSNEDEPFKFNAASELFNGENYADQVSSSIPGTGLAKNLPNGDTDGHGHAHGNGVAHRKPPASDVSSLRSLVTAEDGGDSIHNFVIDLGDGDSVPRYVTDGNAHAKTHSEETTQHATHLQALNNDFDHESLRPHPDADPRSHRGHQYDLPRGPRGDEKPPTEGQQEGATGSGPGQHEEHLSGGLVEGQQGNGEPHYTREQEFPDGEPKALMHTEAAPRELDELGRETVPLPGVHAPVPPGPMNQIELTPRVTHIQVSSFPLGLH